MNSIAIAVDGTGKVSINGREELVEARSYAAAQNQAIDLLVFHAQQHDTDLTVRTNDPETPALLVSPAGTVQPLASMHPIAEPKTERQPAADDETDSSPPPAAGLQPRAAPETEPEPDVSEPAGEPAAAPEPEEPAPASPGNPLTAEDSTQPAVEGGGQRRSQRESFLTQQQAQEPATQGWRGFLSTLGMRVSPGEKEAAERNDRDVVSQHWPGPRTIAIVNGKGGANKTPTTVLLSAVFARYGGGGVLA